MKTYLGVTLGMGLLLLPVSPALAQQPTVQERVVALKASLAASQALLKPYEWVETTVVSLKGDEKSRQMNRCYHGAEGKVQKIPLTTPPPAEKKRGLRARIAENKISSYLDSEKEPVTLDVRFDTLDNNATYASDITLITPAKDLTVNVQNSGYRRM